MPIDWNAPTPVTPPPNWAPRVPAALAVDDETKIPSLVRALATRYGATPRGVLIVVSSGPDEGAAYLVGADGPPDAQGRPTWDLIPMRGDAAALEAAETVRPITEGDGLLILPRLDGTARLLVPPSIAMTSSTVTLLGVPLPTVVLTTK